MTMPSLFWRRPRPPESPGWWRTLPRAFSGVSGSSGAMLPSHTSTPSSSTCVPSEPPGENPRSLWAPGCCTYTGWSVYVAAGLSAVFQGSLTSHCRAEIATTCRGLAVPRCTHQRCARRLQILFTRPAMQRSSVSGCTAGDMDRCADCGGFGRLSCSALTYDRSAPTTDVCPKTSRHTWHASR